MKKLIFLFGLLVAFTAMSTIAVGQQTSALLKIVKDENGVVKVYDMQGNEIHSAEESPLAETEKTTTDKTKKESKSETIQDSPADAGKTDQTKKEKKSQTIQSSSEDVSKTDKPEQESKSEAIEKSPSPVGETNKGKTSTELKKGEQSSEESKEKAEPMDVPKTSIQQSERDDEEVKNLKQESVKGVIIKSVPAKIEPNSKQEEK